MKVEFTSGDESLTIQLRWSNNEEQKTARKIASELLQSYPQECKDRFKHGVNIYCTREKKHHSNHSNSDVVWDDAGNVVIHD